MRSAVNYEIHRLNFGDVTIDAAMQVKGREPGHIVSVPAQGFLIMGGPAPLLVDAGYRDTSVLGSGGQIGPGQGFHEQLAAHGVRAADLGCVLMTHLHRDHAGNLDKVPLDVPILINRSEMACAFSGIQGLAYARQDLQHLVERLYTSGSIRFLDLDYSGSVEVLPGITAQATGGHTAGSMSIVVSTADGEACLCGDLIYDVAATLIDRPDTTAMARVQPCTFAVGEPALTNNHTTSVMQELGALKRILKYRYILPAHDVPGVLEHGQLVGRITGPVVPGPVTAM